MKVSESTTVSLGIVVVLLGGGAWLTALWDSNQANSKAISDLSMSKASEWKSIQEIRETVIRIEERLKHDRRSP